ncbi:hypothetical protein CBS147317_2057 [Penicillium roqueforti]|nr:hypothetical protein CBS147372_1408 [Penicillium roqueforti]KAI3166114.1 hypothetical protein CBS147317_2057 [Penicillium roqueforti]
MSLELYHTAYNAGQTTAVLTHGALVSSLYWDLVIPHLTSYHLLVPDLPGHGKSAGTPFSVDLAARQIVQLIYTYANGSAHIIGYSLVLRLLSAWPIPNQMW